MKRVLFYYDNFCGPDSKGGTEVATYRIAQALKNSGEVEVFNAYRSNSGHIENSVYSEVLKLSHSGFLFRKELADFIIRHDIGFVVNMGRFFRHPNIVDAVKKSGRDVKIFFMQHFAPGSEMKKSSFSSGLHLLRLNPLNPLYWLRASFYPLIKLPRKLSLPKAYRNVYDSSDKVILLSEGYIKDYCQTALQKDKTRFVALPNIYDPDLIRSNGCEKNSKRVLILSRLDEIQKRISLALKIWQKIEADPDLYDWKLDIVGNGHNADIVKRMVRKLNLQNVTVHGWQPREEFLKKAEVLMLTSEYEGLPLSVLEAQAYGCIPIAFNSFASLKDVVEPFYNGVIIEEFGDVEDYTKKLTELMYDVNYRKELSRNAKDGAGRFSSKIIADKWLEILT